MRVQLVVNQTRVRTDTELGAWMSGLVSRHFGVALDELGHVEHDDTVWLTVRRNKPLLVDSPASKSARNIERIARRVLALTATKSERPPPSPVPDRGPDPLRDARRDALGERRGDPARVQAPARDLRDRAASPRRRCSTRRSSPRAQRKLDEAYDTLLDLVRRRAYDLSTFPEPEPEVLVRAHDAPRARRRAAHAPGGAASARLAPRRSSPGRSSARCASRRGSSSPTSARRRRLRARTCRPSRTSASTICRRSCTRAASSSSWRSSSGSIRSHVQKTYLRRMREELAARGKELA